MRYEKIKKNKIKINQWCGNGFGCGLIEGGGAEIVFEATAGYVREMYIIEGEAIVAGEGESVMKLKEGEAGNFTAEIRTKCFGKFKGWCFTIEKENFGIIDNITITEDNKIYPVESKSEYKNFTQGFYVKSGYAIINMDSGTVALEEGDEILIYGDKHLQSQIGLMGEGTVLRMQMFTGLNDVTESKTADGGKADSTEAAKGRRKKRCESCKERPKATFDDFKMAVIISATNFRQSRRLFKFNKKNWLDQEITEVLDNIRKKYVAIIIWIVAVMFIMAAGMTIKGFTFLALLSSIVTWSLIQVLILMPLIYLMFLPRPVRKHVKPLGALNEYECSIRQQEIDSLPKKKRALKRY